MNEPDQIKAIAKLDYQDIRPITKASPLPPYLTSRDAIISVIEKQGEGVSETVKEFLIKQNVRPTFLATPPQLCEALLRATGKWIEAK